MKLELEATMNADSTNIQPSPFDWHKASDYLPRPDEIVVVHQLYGWAVHDGNKWLAVDLCGNRGYLAWQPRYWRRQYFPSEPTGVAA